MSSIDDNIVVSPRHYASSDDGDIEYLVFMRLEDGEFAVHVDKNYIRRFTLDTMPVQLKQSLAMVHAFNWKEILTGRRYIPMSFKSFFPEGAKEIGWMTGPGEYALVLNVKVLDELSGSSPKTAY